MRVWQYRSRGIVRVFANPCKDPTPAIETHMHPCLSPWRELSRLELPGLLRKVADREVICIAVQTTKKASPSL